jgi:hypothetical protein
MDLWVVKYASRRSRIGDFSGDSSVRGAWIRDVLASRASAWQRELSAQGVEPDEGGSRPGSGQLESTAGARAGVRGGAQAGKLRWVSPDPGRFGLSRECRPTGVVGSGLNRMETGFGGGSAQLESIEGPGRCSGRYSGGQTEMGEDLLNDRGCSMAAMIFKVPPHWGHRSMWMSNTRLSNRVQLLERRRHRRVHLTVVK